MVGSRPNSLPQTRQIHYHLLEPKVGGPDRTNSRPGGPCGHAVPLSTPGLNDPVLTTGPMKPRCVSVGGRRLDLTDKGVQGPHGGIFLGHLGPIHVIPPFRLHITYRCARPSQKRGPSLIEYGWLPTYGCQFSEDRQLKRLLLLCPPWGTGRTTFMPVCELPSCTLSFRPTSLGTLPRCKIGPSSSRSGVALVKPVLDKPCGVGGRFCVNRMLIKAIIVVGGKRSRHGPRRTSGRSQPHRFWKASSIALLNPYLSFLSLQI